MSASAKTLSAAIAAVVCAILLIAGYCISLPSQSDFDPTRDYGGLYSGVKSESVVFAMAGATEETIPMFGSSELAIDVAMIPQAPSAVFSGPDDGIDVRYVGEAYDQSLWHAIALGAYAPEIPSKKAAFIVSPGWFEDEELEPGIFKLRFSYSLYNEFCENPNVSEATKDYVRKRLLEEGVDSALVNAALRTDFVSAVNDAVFAAMADIHLRQSLQEVRASAPLRANVQAPLNLDILEVEAEAIGAQWCSNNSYYIYDAYWTEYLAPEYEDLADSDVEETLSNEKEYEDFSCFLDVCKECGIDPLIVVMPVNGYWYDYTGLDPQLRAAYYDRINSICAEAGVKVVDFSQREYEPFIMKDIMHFGWKGWAIVDKALYEFMGGA